LATESQRHGGHGKIALLRNKEEGGRKKSSGGFTARNTKNADEFLTALTKLKEFIGHPSPPFATFVLFGG
jgi:hypothetical protein